MDRAQHHSRHGYGVGVVWPELVEHLGFARTSATTRKLRPQVARLVGAGLVETGQRYANPVWRLTSDGRKQVAKARRKREALELPESPQHRAWRHARANAGRRSGRLREQLRSSVGEAAVLLDGCGDSDAYFRLRHRIGPQLEQLGAAVYCLREWPEPDDAVADIDHGSEYSQHRRNVQLGEAGEYA